MPAVPWQGRTVSLRRFLEATDTRAFVVVRRGVITYEWYAAGVHRTTLLSSWSMEKSITSLLVGQLIAEHRLSEEERVVTVLPELKTGGGYDSITIRDLLDMRSGIDSPENISPQPPLSGTALMYFTDDLPAYVRQHRRLSYTPGTQFGYESINSQLLAEVVARVTGKPVSQVLQERLWAPIGAESDAAWSLDRRGGLEKGFCCINATARDYAKVGWLVANGGRAGSRQVIPRVWIDRISTPAVGTGGGGGYAAQWWFPLPGRDFTAVGLYGQYLYVDPVRRVSIVKLSDSPPAQHDADFIPVFRAVSRAH